VESKKVYLRTFAALLGIWLLLMLGFSAWMLYNARTAAQERFIKDIRLVSDTLENAGRDDAHRLALQQTLPTISQYAFETGDFQFAVYDADFRFLYDSGGTWSVGCLKEISRRTYTTEYAFFYPDRWFSAEEIAQLLYYLNYYDGTMKVGNLQSYDVRLSGWLDGDEFIPEKIIVAGSYVSSYTQKDGITGGYSSAVNFDYVLETRAADTEGLPYIESAWVSLVNYDLSYTSPQDSATSAAVTDGLNVKNAAEDFFDNMADGDTLLKTTPIGLFRERCRMLLPCRGLEYTDGVYRSEYWLAAAGECNYLSGVWKTLLAVWLTCLCVFAGTAWILSAQTVKTVRRRAAIERQRRDTTNAIAHDLKTPLAAISGYAENLSANVHTEKREYYAGRIQAQVQRMDGLLQEMLRLSRLESGAQTLKPQTFSLHIATEEAAEPFGDVFAEKQIAFTITGETELRADRSLIVRAIGNFLSNAAANTDAGGAVSIVMDGQRWSITNTGAPIPEAQLHMIWRAYYKTDGARSGLGGSGLGLSIVRSIMALHDFDYGVENLSSGVRFWFAY
jgi:signal transduction histidine kinase